MLGFKFWNDDEPFDKTTTHTFEPSKELIVEAVECSQTTTVGGETENGKLTQAMRRCKHDEKWEFSPGFPSNIIGCSKCSYWRFID